MEITLPSKKVFRLSFDNETGFWSDVSCEVFFNQDGELMLIPIPKRYNVKNPQEGRAFVNIVEQSSAAILKDSLGCDKIGFFMSPTTLF